MAHILIGNIDKTTKELLEQRAARRGQSLQAYLRDEMARLANEEVASPDSTAPFGDWLLSISRPGADLEESLELLRSAAPRSAPPE